MTAVIIPPIRYKRNSTTLTAATVANHRRYDIPSHFERTLSLLVFHLCSS